MLHLCRAKIKGDFNPLTTTLNPIRHLLEFLGAHHILHVSRAKIKGDFNPLTTKLNPISHLLELFGARHILHVSRVRVNFLVNIVLTMALLKPNLAANIRIITKYYTDISD
jgi:flagellar biosynthesis protein FlhB